MKKLLVLLFSLLASFNSYGEEVELDFSLDTFCDQSPKAQVRNGLFYLPNQQKPYSGENLCVYLSNGQYYSRGEIQKGLREGKWEYWYENGQKKEERKYTKGRERGEGGSYITRYENGQKMMEFTYNKNGGLVKSEYWYENGQKREEQNYKDDELDGMQISWNKSGQVSSEENYKDRKLIGETKYQYFLNGQKISEKNYIDGVFDGINSFWYENGQKSTEVNYINGKREGIRTEWYENGQIKEVKNYKDGKKDGKETWRYENGQIKSVQTYKDGKLDGKWTVWDENGQINSEKIYKDGELVSEINYKAKREAEAERELAEEKAREAERIAQQLAWENEQYNRLLTEEVQAEQDQERPLVIEDQLNTLKSAYVGNIAARIRSFWRYQGAEDDWTAEVYVVQDRDGTVVAVDVRNANVDDSSRAKAFKDSIRRAVYKASPLPTAPDESVFDRELMITFSVN